MIDFLWANREKPAVASHRWFVVWAKRLLSFFALMRIRRLRREHAARGMVLGELSILSGLEVNGKSTNIAIGPHSFIGANVHIASHARVDIGAFVCINSDVRILSGTHDLSDPKWRMYAKPIQIGDYAWIATGAIILPGVSIGRGAVVGAGAVVASDLPDYSAAYGNPARIKLDRRVRNLEYDPVIFAAPYEAWIGRNVSLKSDTRAGTSS